MGNSRRRDPYRNFNFRVLFGAIGGIAALGLVRKFFTRARRQYPGVYIEEVPAGSRPIEGVGTSTAGFVGKSPKQSARRHSRSTGVRKTAGKAVRPKV